MKSNAIVVADDGATVGVGMGQVNRVDAARLAVQRAGDRVRGAVAASDAFFPFPDGLETLTEAGVKAIVHPGGSMRDDVVTEAAAKAGITLYLTGARHFAHWFAVERADTRSHDRGRRSATARARRLPPLGDRRSPAAELVAS